VNQRQPERPAGRCPGRLGITLHVRSLMPEGLAETPATLRLPDTGEVEFVVTTRRAAGGCDPGERRSAAGSCVISRIGWNPRLVSLDAVSARVLAWPVPGKSQSLPTFRQGVCE
jgi:hypothetical protein